MMKQRMIRFFSLLLIFVSSPGMSTAQKIEVTIRTNKDTYITGEPIFFESTFHNASNDTFELHPADYTTYLFNEKNERFSSNIIIDWGPSKWKPNFPPGYVRKFSGGDLFGGFGVGGGSDAPTHLPPGKYRVYYAGKAKGRPVRKKGEKRKVVFFKSNDVHFKIVEPEGDDKIVWELLCKAQYYKRRPNLDDEKVEEYYSTILKNYPDSIYIPRILYLSAIFNKFSPNLEFKRLSNERYKQLVRMYPDSYYVIRIIRAMIYRYQKEGVETNEEFFKEIISNYPDTRAAKQAKKYRDEEYWNIWEE